MIAFLIQGETPSKKNSRIINTKTGRSFPSKKFTEWHKNAALQVRAQLPNGFKPIDYPVSVSLMFTHGDRRRRDSDNGCSSILDLLTDCGVIQDDNYEIVRDINIGNFYEKNAASCEIIIRKLDA